MIFQMLACIGASAPMVWPACGPRVPNTRSEEFEGAGAGRAGADRGGGKDGIKPIKYCTDLFLARWSWLKLCESLKTYTLTIPVNDQLAIPKGYLRW